MIMARFCIQPMVVIRITGNFRPGRLFPGAQRLHKVPIMMDCEIGTMAREGISIIGEQETQPFMPGHGFTHKMEAR